MKVQLRMQELSIFSELINKSISNSDLVHQSRHRNTLHLIETNQLGQSNYWKILMQLEVENWSRKGNQV
ncbi:unnamed protein product (macronuclear) [Paramecium tetraurelia]|uniref:Uncharacterized protein n=1 Tax=Paramecium tetraurelia TaxID=5888 RepID=A0BUU8_PARTE|nr:uncharacterized protein GSPATT00005561001 [Paramecium tetraurelia]CAK62315.1 unnamed protein product [Paramecium tetraurelia]|eukprot:XP_001429713.1 hypothetical protein (macronuclear) [Paramecium tetraurelia strain d4-2]